MNKYKALIGLSLVTAGVYFLTSCASNDDETTSSGDWGTTSVLYSSANITESLTAVSNNGDVILVWKEEESEVRDNTQQSKLCDDSKAATPQGYYAYKNQYSKTTVHAMHFSSATSTWSNKQDLANGYWQKTKSGHLANKDDCSSEVVFTENVNSLFAGDYSLALNVDGDAILAWISLKESVNIPGDAETTHVLMVALYDAQTNAWSSPEKVLLTEQTVLKNEVAVGINSNSTAQIAWVARDENTNVSNLFGASYADAAWSTPVVLNDGQHSVQNITLLNRNGSSGVANWLQNEDSGSPDNTVRSKLYSRWFTSTGWNAAPSFVSNANTSANNYSIASNGVGKIWLAWEESTAIGVALNTVWATQFSGDIDSDLATGSWSTGQNIQPDDTSTSKNESTLASSQTNLAVDSSGNVLVAWVETGGGELASDQFIRAIAYEQTNRSWRSSSDLVSTPSLFVENDTAGRLLSNQHINPKVVASAANHFTIIWQHADREARPAGSNVYAVDYDFASGQFSKIIKASQDSSANIHQMDLLAANGKVQMIWSDYFGENKRLIRSAP